MGATSAYKADLCSVHVPVGKRGVALAPEYMAAYEESKRAAQRNKQVRGRAGGAAQRGTGEGSCLEGAYARYRCAVVAARA